VSQTLKPVTREQVAAELRDKMVSVPPAVIGNKAGRWMMRAVMKMMRGKAHDGVRVEKRMTEGGVALRVYTPERGKTGAALLWIHGGGLVIGSPMQDDQFCADTARDLGMVVISTAYRLAPDFPFPAALDDCHAAWTWLQRSAQALGIDPARVVVGGQSAGGGLAASLVQRIYDGGGVQPAAQWLFCPMLDDRTAARRELDAVGHLVWNNRANRVGWSGYLGGAVGAERVPEYAVPARRDDLRGLPPAWIGTGDIELFYDEDKTYAERLTGAGIDCTLDIVPGAPHGFEALAPDSALAQAYLARAREWLAAQLGDAK
jgi:acetyl esterase/lipase